MKPRMKKELDDYLDEGERILWKRLPRRGKLYTGLKAVQISGHVFLTFLSVFFAYYFHLSIPHRIFLGFLLICTTNAPLIIWSRYRLPRFSSGDALFFLTDKRVGLIRPGGEIRQAPICPGLDVSVKPHASIIEFSLGERTPVSFGGLSKEEMLLVSSVTEGLIKKCE